MPLSVRTIGRRSVDELCACYDNEDVHTEHVTALALSLFDHTHRWLGLSAHLRPLLEAAGRLHDVGYSIDPIHHVQASAEIVLEEGLKGFRKSERDKIIQIMVRHSGKWSLTGASKRLSQLAAFLRIGDGLDYSHAQTAKIAGVRRAQEVICVTVRCGVFPQCLVRANRKADLWRAVFPYDIRFIAAPMTDPHSVPLLQPRLPVLEAARRLMWIQFKMILTNLDAAVEGQMSKPLHDIRVALRRMHRVLRAFRKHLPDEPRKEIEAVLDEISEELGPVRDLDVWIDLLRSPGVQQAMGRSRLWPAFLRHHVQLRQFVYATVRRCLRGPHFAAQRFKINRLLRAELPGLIRTEPHGSLPKLAATQVGKALRRARKSGHLRHSTSPGQLHELRIALRKARYLGEFFGSTLGPHTAKLIRRIHQVEQVLGSIHDIDMAVEHLAHEGPVPPQALMIRLRELRKQNLEKLEKMWGRLADVTLRENVERELETANTASFGRPS